MLVIVLNRPCYTEELITGTPLPPPPPVEQPSMKADSRGSTSPCAPLARASATVAHNIILRPTPDFGKEWKSEVGRKINLRAIVAWMNILIWFCLR